MSDGSLARLGFSLLGALTAISIFGFLVVLPALLVVSLTDEDSVLVTTMAAAVVIWILVFVWLWRVLNRDG